MNSIFQKARYAAALLLLALGACGGGGGDDSGTSPPAGTVIGAAGGTVVGPSGVTVVVPAGALATNVTIAIAQTSAGALALPGTLTASGPMFALTPHGTTFAVPVTITLPFEPASVPAGLTPQLYKTNAQGQWEQIANAVFGATTVTAQITSFSFGQVVIPPLQRNDPVRVWQFLVYPGSGGAATALPAPNEGGTQTGGVVFDVASFGFGPLDAPIVGLTETLPENSVANGLAFSSADGVTYGVFTEAPFGPVGGADPIGSRTQLKQTQSFIKRAADATLSFTVTQVRISARDFQPPPDRGDRFIYAEVLLSVGAYKTPSSYFFYTAGKASVFGAHKIWIPNAQDESFSRTHLWDMSNFEFTTADAAYLSGIFSCPGTQAVLLLKIPLTHNVDLSSVNVGEEFTLRADTYAETNNRRGGPAPFFDDCLGSAASAFLKDPSDIGGTTFTMTGLEATNRPLSAPPEQVLVVPAACVPGPGPNAAAGVLQFSAASYSVSEFAGAPSTVTVTRTGGSSGAVTATFTTSDGTGIPTVTSSPAIAGVDYAAVNTTVFFGDGDAGARLVTVPTIQNLVRAPDKTLNLTLSQPGGCAALGAQTTAVLTILDDGGAELPAPPSGLDASFGNQGKASTTAFGGDRSAMALQADGKIVIVGGTFTDFILARFNANGSLDTSFGVAGKVVTDMVSGQQEEALGVAIQGDGRIIVVGYTRPGLGFNFALARYNTDGSLDGSFGVGGKVTSGVAGLAYAVAIQPDGRIVVAGELAITSPIGTDFADFALARFNPNGSLDTTFGSAGRLTTDIGAGTNSARNIVLQPNGAIVVSGNPIGTAAGFDHTDMARYDSNGGLDATFGSGGKLSLGGALVGEGLALQGDGRFVLVGSVNVGTGATATARFALMRLNTNASPDTSFGNAGTVSTDISGRGDSAFAVAIQNDGRIVVAGRSSDQVSSDFALARYNLDGTLDTNFGNGFGIFTVDFFGSTDIAESVVLQADGKIVLGGLARNNVDGYGLARFNP